jgi:hypothetical protein
MENDDDCVPDTSPFRGILAECYCSVVPRRFAIAHGIHTCHECDIFREQINILPEEAKNQPFTMNQDNKQGAMLEI